MPRRSVGGYLVLARVLWRDILFRVIAAAALVIVASIFATRSSDEPGQEKNRENQSEQRASSKVNDDGYLGIGPDGWTAIFTGVLAFFTVVLSATAVTQIVFLVRADETARRSADAAKESADVARRTVESIESASEKQLRAYVLIEAALEGDAKGNVIIGDITFKNFGQTPALNVVIRRGIDVLAISGNEVSDNIKPLQPTILGPGSRTNAVAVLQNATVKSSQIIEICQKGFSVVVFGTVTYDDVFGKERVTEFRLFFIPAVGGGNHIVPCPDGNRST